MALSRTVHTDSSTDGNPDSAPNAVYLRSQLRIQLSWLYDQGDHLPRTRLMHEWVPRLFSGAERQRLRVDLLELPTVHTDADADGHSNADTHAHLHATDPAANEFGLLPGGAATGLLVLCPTSKRPL